MLFRSIAWAIPDHPWVDAASGANVRIAMTVGTALPSPHAVGRGAGGEGHGLLQTVVAEGSAESDAVHVEFSAKAGRIHADLTIGADVVGARALQANEGVANRGIQVFGAGFVVTSDEATKLQPCDRLRPYRNGKDLTDQPRGVSIIDLYGLSADEARSRYPAAYQWVLERVKPERDQNNRASYRDNWWLLGENQPLMRAAISDLNRYIVTTLTAKHRIFQFIDGSILPDQAWWLLPARMLIPLEYYPPKFMSVGLSLLAVHWKTARATTKPAASTHSPSPPPVPSSNPASPPSPNSSTPTASASRAPTRS